jgi:hypothetical protein
MTMVCSCCTHLHRALIDQALIAGTSLRDIARQFNVSKDAVSRHKIDHLPEIMVRSEEARKVAHADDLLREANRLYAVATTVMEAGQKAKDYGVVLKAVTAAGRVLALLVELLGEINRQLQVNVTLTAEWIEVRAVIIEALAEYPEARAQVALALQGVNSGNG